MYNFGMIKVPTNFYASPASGPAPTPADDGTPDSERNRKPRTRLSKWLAKIAGVYEEDMEPKTEAEYYLNEIAAKGGGGSASDVLILHDNDGTLDKTWQEIFNASGSQSVILLKGGSGYRLICYLVGTYVPGADSHKEYTVAFRGYDSGYQDVYVCAGRNDFPHE